MTTSMPSSIRAIVAVAAVVILLSLAVSRADAHRMSFDSTGAPVAIVDAGHPGTVAGKDILLTGITDPVIDVDVIIRVDHEFVGDLVIQLEGPDGTKITLANQPGVSNAPSGAPTFGGASANLSSDVPITFDDSAATSAELMGGGGLGTTDIVGSAPSSPDTYRPSTDTFLPGPMLSEFNGRDPNGTWTLTVGDAVDVYTGELVSWTLIIETEPVIPEPTVAGVMALGVVGLLSRRRRRRV